MIRPIGIELHFPKSTYKHGYTSQSTGNPQACQFQVQSILGLVPSTTLNVTIYCAQVKIQPPLKAPHSW